MTNEERQRILREAGFGPAEAEKQEGARQSRESLRREEGERAAEDGDRQTENKPLAEDDEARPRPRR
jgi:hypothetical protein